MVTAAQPITEWPVRCAWCLAVTGTTTVEGSSSICARCLAAHFPEVHDDAQA